MAERPNNKKENHQMAKEHPTEGYAAEYYGDHASFVDEKFKDDYAFRVEFHPEMSEAQRKAITGMIEAGPKLLAAVRLYESGRGTPAMLHKAMSEALGVAELWIEDIPQAVAEAPDQIPFADPDYLHTLRKTKPDGGGMGGM